MRILLIGSHPKGFNEPFHPNTRSGKILRSILDENSSSYIFFDLWEDEKDQLSGKVSKDTLASLHAYLQNDFQLIALGRIVEKALTKHEITHRYLPHPASRRKSDQELLKVALKKLS